MLHVEANLAVELGGEPCMTLKTEEGRCVIQFANAASFRRAAAAIRHTPVPMPLRRLLAAPGQSWLPPAVIKVGGDVIGEIVPGEAPSALARLAGLPLPGLNLRPGSIVKALLAGIRNESV